MRYRGGDIEDIGGVSLRDAAAAGWVGNWRWNRGLPLGDEGVELFRLLVLGAAAWTRVTRCLVRFAWVILYR